MYVALYFSHVCVWSIWDLVHSSVPFPPDSYNRVLWHGWQGWQGSVLCYCLPLSVDCLVLPSLMILSSQPEGSQLFSVGCVPNTLCVRHTTWHSHSLTLTHTHMHTHAHTHSHSLTLTLTHTHTHTHTHGQGEGGREGEWERERERETVCMTDWLADCQRQQNMATMT